MLSTPTHSGFQGWVRATSAPWSTLLLPQLPRAEDLHEAVAHPLARRPRSVKRRLRSCGRMDDRTLRARAHAGLVAHTRLLGAYAGELVEEHDWLACVVPHAPQSSILNCVVGVPDVQRAHTVYKQAGVEKWGVWLDSQDVAGARKLQDAGLILDSMPVVMGAELDALELADAPQTQPVDLRTLGAVNDRAYGYHDGRLERAIAALPPAAVDPHSIVEDEEPVAVTFILEVG